MSVFKPAQPVYLVGPEICLPQQIISNADLLAFVPGASFRPEWITQRTGVAERRWASDDEACSDLATGAASRLMAKHALAAGDVAQVVLATISGDYPSPPTAPLVQHRLGLPAAGAFDLGAACAGFVSALHVCAGLCMASGENHLLIAADIRSKFIDRSSLAVSSLFGDGAAAALLTTARQQAAYRLVASELRADGALGDAVVLRAGGSRLPFSCNREPQNLTIQIASAPALFIQAVDAMVQGGLSLLAKTGHAVKDLAWLVPHQANLHMMRDVGRKLGFAAEQVIEVIQSTGNTSGASVGLALHALTQSGRPRHGDLVLLVSAGGGGLAACALLEYVGAAA